MNSSRQPFKITTDNSKKNTDPNLNNNLSKRSGHEMDSSYLNENNQTDTFGMDPS